ncbi:zinc ribbon domain-containing protein [uncultured Bacteroides sp.]|uniref:double zinc ribbon domain-containing protein n=1 Tax=uncultured Bacteroides sp. TaxID=162156 RepID=UPI0026283708|nr:zinc ribbon domain-containing protein [uncultured Bacteroides sp.]
MKCITCGAENQNTAKYCLECGSPLFKKCDYCLTQTSINAKFCPYCGKQFKNHSIEVIKYKNKLTFYDYIFIESTPLGKYIKAIDNHRYTLLDIKTCSPIFDYIFEDVGTQKDYQNFCFVKKNGKWAIVNPISGKLVTDFVYDAYRTNDHAGSEFRVLRNEKWGKVDANSGKTTVPHIYDDIEYDDRVKQNGYWGWLNSRGKSIPCEYIKLSSYVFSDNIRPSQHKSGKWGVINRGGEIIINFDYDEITYHEPFGHSLYYLRKGNLWGLYCDGKQYPCNYTLEEVKKLKWY